LSQRVGKDRAIDCKERKREENENTNTPETLRLIIRYRPE